MIEIEVPFIPYDRIKVIIVEVLLKYHSSHEIPFPIEELIEFDFNFEIRGIFGLLRETGSPGMLSLDQSIIFVDESVLSSKSNYYYRFTLAHELGHKLLHSRMYSSMNLTNMSEMKRFYLELSEDQRKSMETQANNFAGLLLVPTGPLKKAFREAENMIPEELRGGHSDDTVLGYLRDFISKRFQVSSEVIRIRLEKEGLTL